MLCISRGERHSYMCIAVERHTKGQDEYSHHKWAALGTKARTTADEGKVTFFFCGSSLSLVFVNLTVRTTASIQLSFHSTVVFPYHWFPPFFFSTKASSFENWKLTFALAASWALLLHQEKRLMLTHRFEISRQHSFCYLNEKSQPRLPKTTWFVSLLPFKAEYTLSTCCISPTPPENFRSISEQEFQPISVRGFLTCDLVNNSSPISFCYDP